MGRRRARVIVELPVFIELSQMARLWCRAFSLRFFVFVPFVSRLMRCVENRNVMISSIYAVGTVRAV